MIFQRHLNLRVLNYICTGLLFLFSHLLTLPIFLYCFQEPIKILHNWHWDSKVYQAQCKKKAKKQKNPHFSGCAGSHQETSNKRRRKWVSCGRHRKMFSILQKKKKICWPTEWYVHLFYLFILLLRKYDGFDRRHFANTGRSFDKNTQNSAFTLIKPWQVEF